MIEFEQLISFDEYFLCSYSNSFEISLIEYPFEKLKLWMKIKCSGCPITRIILSKCNCRFSGLYGDHGRVVPDRSSALLDSSSRTISAQKVRHLVPKPSGNLKSYLLAFFCPFVYYITITKYYSEHIKSGLWKSKHDLFKTVNWNQDLGKCSEKLSSLVIFAKIRKIFKRLFLFFSKID